MAGQHVLTRRMSSRSRRLVQILVSVVLVGAIFMFAFKRVDVSSVWTEITRMTWIEGGTITAVAAWNLITYLWLWVLVTPGLSFRRAMIVTQSGTAVTNVVPGGSAIGVGLAYSMFSSWGFSRTRSTVAILVSGAWNMLIKFGMPMLALVLLALQGDVTPQRVVAGVVGLGLLAASVIGFVRVFCNDGAAARVGSLAGRAVAWFRRRLRRPAPIDWGPKFVVFRHNAAGLLRRRWPVITVAALVSHLSLYLVLLVSLRHVGVTDNQVGWAQVLAVFALGRLLTLVRFTPGGAGATEAVLIAGLAAAGGERAEVAAAVLVFRGLTWLLPVPIGVLAFVSWRRWRARAGSAGKVGAATEPSAG
jgi:putative heme transporter